MIQKLLKIFIIQSCTCFGILSVLINIFDCNCLISGQRGRGGGGYRRGGWRGRGRGQRW